MKLFVGFVIAALALNVALALPAGPSPKKDAETVDTADSDEYFRDYKGVVDTGDLPFPRPRPFAFSFDMSSFADLLKHLRSRLCLACEETGIIGGAGGILGTDGETITSIQDKGKTTSSVKVVDGHKVEINETVYDKGDGIFRVRVVNVRPLESGEEVEETAVVQQGEGEGEAEPKSDSTFTTEGPSKTNPRSELLESDEEGENEIRRGELQSESIVAHAQHNTLLPTAAAAETEITTTTTIETTTPPSSAAINEDDVANLNGAFVTDNSLAEAEATEAAKTEQPLDGAHNSGEEPGDAEVLKENGYGNFKAETNKSENDSDKMGNERDEDLATSFTATEAEDNGEWSVVSELRDEEADVDGEAEDDVAADDDGNDDEDAATVDEGHHLTIGNNEESEVNDNFNESSVDDVAAATGEQGELTKEPNERMQLIELSESANEEDGDDGASRQADVDAADADNEDKDNSPIEESMKESIVRGADKDREDALSSDDEEADTEIRMSDAFNSEWSSLATDDLSNRRPVQKGDDLSNDIDSYEPIAFDLSNDIAVNDIAAAQADYQPDPEAEFIDLSKRFDAGPMKMPMFEKLTMSEPQMK